MHCRTNSLIEDRGHPGQDLAPEPGKKHEGTGGADERLVDELCQGSVSSAEEKLREKPEVEEAYRGYLEAFGDRCLEELKLESSTLVDTPLPLLRSIGAHEQTVVRGNVDIG